LELPPRQGEIAFLLVDGLGDKQIATKLKLHLPTVRTHLNRLFDRCGVSDRLGLVIHVFKTFRRMNDGE